MAKITLDDILPVSRYEELADSANKMAELSEEKFSLLLNFMEENKNELIQKIDTTKYLDDTHKIKEGMEEEYHKASFSESLKFCEEKKREYFVNEGIFLGNYIIGMPIKDRSFLGHRSSSFNKENEIL